jgi:hypothetical protein
MLKATVSGSFHRHMSAIYEAVGALADAGVTVLSPSDPRIVDHHGEFLFVASDYSRSIRLVQDRHFASISASSFVWLVAPDGYVGVSAAMEIGAAVTAGVDVYCSSDINDITLSQYITRVRDIRECLEIASARAAAVPSTPDLLLNPLQSIEESQRVLENLADHLGSYASDHVLVERSVSHARRELSRTFGSPVIRRRS